MKKYMIYTKDNELVGVDDYRFKDREDLKFLVDKEVFSKSASELITPRNLKYLKRFGIDWEEMSDKGHMRYQPKAALMFDLISTYALNRANSLNIPIYQIKGTNMFKLSEPAVKEHADLFGERLYEVRDENERYILRYAACHQQFAAIRHWGISFKNLPFGAYENADSYRLEQSGELLLGFRTRRMNMPDLHIFPRNIEEAKEITLDVHKKIFDEFEGNLGRNLVNIYNLTESFFNENRNYINRLLEIEKNSVLLNFIPENKYYWVINVEHNIIDNIKNPREIATFQIDVGNSKRFGIKYIDESGVEVFPPIIHTALIGTIERYIYTLFDTAVLKETQGEPPFLPLWVSPTQVRLIPISDKHREYVIDIGKKLREYSIRAEVDDRRSSVARRVANAEKDWANYILVVGDREKNSEIFSIRDKSKGKIDNMSLDEFINSLNYEIGNKPRVRPYFPLELSKIPIFT